MIKKYPAPALITILSFVISIVGIIDNILYTPPIYTADTYSAIHIQNVALIQDLLDPLNLSLVFSRYAGRYDGHNYVNGIFDIFLLVGAIIYVTSKNTQARLIRFVFSVIFFSNILLFVHTFLYSLLVKSFFSLGLKDIFIDVIFYIVQAFWIYISYRILQYFNRNHELETVTSEVNGINQTYFIDAFSGKRFLHLIIDSFVTLVIFSPILRLIIYIDHNTRSLFYYVLIFLLFASYYLFYESTLGITPAKLLTETRVLDYEGNKPKFKNIFVRTCSRLVPLEAFSFLLKANWHDKWSQTIVVNEKETEEFKEPMNAFAIFGINFGALIIYLGIIVNSQHIPDSFAAYLLTCHLLICIFFAVSTKRPVWWILACIVAFPLTSLFFNH